MKKFKEAGKYYLRALSMIPKDKGDHIWEYLGMNFYLMKRNDLVEKCRNKDVDDFKNWENEE
jgi:hypothetical protein